MPTKCSIDLPASRIDPTAVYDVIVVGARCAGSALARLLAQAGLRVVAVDRASFPSDTLSTHAISTAGSVLLEQWGVWQRIIASQTPVAQTMGVRIGTIDVAAVPVAEPSPGAMAPRRTVLDAILVDAAREAGADVVESFTVRSLIWQQGAAAGVRGTTADGNPAMLRAPLVVGADGAESLVARQANAGAYDERPSATNGVYAYYDGVAVEQNEVALAAGSVAFALPTNDGLTCLAAADAAWSPARSADDEILGAVMRTIPRIADHVAGARRVTRRHHFRARQAVKRVPYGPGWALVGDAGLYMDPITGHGISNAFITASLLAEAVITGLGGDVSLQTALSAYHSRRDAFLSPVYDVTAELSLLSWTDEAVVTLFMRFLETVQELVGAVAGESSARTM